MDFNLEELKKNHRTAYMVAEYERLLKEEADVNAMLASDPSMAELTWVELKNIFAQKEAIEKQIQSVLESQKEEETKPTGVILEVRAGAGGDEASLFAWELAEMYQKFAEKLGF